MFHNRGARSTIAALSIAVGTSVALPGLAAAEPPNPPVAQHVAEPASPTASALAQARVLLASVPIPPQARSTIERVITFLDGSGGGGPKIPSTDAPVIAQFLYPTIGKGCVSPTADSVGSAFAVPGPAGLPVPGPKAGQAAFVFTALGTALAKVQPAPLTVTWINIDNGRRATQDLTGAAKINLDGPATLSVTADTGPGRVLAVVSGSLTTQPKSAGSAPITCGFAPTVGVVTVGSG